VGKRKGIPHRGGARMTHLLNHGVENLKRPLSEYIERVSMRKYMQETLLRFLVNSNTGGKWRDLKPHRQHFQRMETSNLRHLLVNMRFNKSCGQSQKLTANLENIRQQYQLHISNTMNPTRHNLKRTLIMTLSIHVEKSQEGRWRKLSKTRKVSDHVPILQTAN
jgi:hypothetical protein